MSSVLPSKSPKQLASRVMDAQTTYLLFQIVAGVVSSARFMVDRADKRVASIGISTWSGRERSTREILRGDRQKSNILIRIWFEGPKNVEPSLRCKRII